MGVFGWWWYQERGLDFFDKDSGAETSTTEGTKGSELGAAGQGRVRIEAVPWGRIETVIETGGNSEVPMPAGSPFTPRLVALAEGSYEITLTHPEGGTRSCRVDARIGTEADCTVRFFETEPRAFFQEVGW